MEEQPSHTNHTTLITTVVLAGVVGYLLYQNISIVGRPQTSQNTAEASMVMVENTIAVDGVLRAPENFPANIPFESVQIVESAVTHHPLKQAEQLSMSYRSSKTISQKYDEYKEYMTQAGYQVKEENQDNLTKSLSGVRDGATLYVGISNNIGKTTVYISYVTPAI